MSVAANFEPAKYGQALKVERDSGIPAKTAYENMEQVQAVKQTDRLNSLFYFAPRTADALSEPNHAIVAKGDEDTLSDMEKAIIRGDFQQQGFFERQIAAPLRKWWNQDTINDAPGRLVQLDRVSGDFDKVDAGEAFDSPWANEYRAADEAGRKVMRDNLNLERNLSLDSVRVAQFGLNQAVTDPGDVAFQEAEGVGGVFDVLMDDPLWAGRVAAQSVPDMAQSLAWGLINPLFGGVAEGDTAAKYKFLEVLKEKGVDPGDPVQLLSALRNDDLLQEANERSVRYGAGIGAVSLASFGLLGRTLAPTRIGGRQLGPRGREAINAGLQVPVQGGLEALGELTGQVAERGRTSDIDSKEIALEGALGALMAGPEAGAFAGKRFVNHMIQARRTERASQLQGELVDKSLESSTRQHDPASFERIVGTLLAGQANEWIEIPAAKLQELNQSGMLNLPEILENTGIDPEHFTAQEALGGTVRMKNSSYLAYLAEHDEQLGSSIRVTSNDYSLDDVQELDRQMVADMEKVASQFGSADQLASAYSDVVGQLLNAGYERGAADTTARQYAAVIARLAEQTGQTTEQLMQANPLRIGREVPAAVQRIRGDQLSLLLSRLRAGDVPQAGDLFGKTLSEYLRDAGGLNDEGGELAALDADVGKVGRNRLARDGGLSLDDAAMQAWERGYFPGVPREEVGPQLIVDAVREELAGNPRYSSEQENATLRDQAASLGSLQAHLDELGVDLETTTDEEVLALLRGSQEEDQTLNQSATETAQQLTARLTDETPGLKLDLFSRNGRATLSRIVLPEGQREGGTGTRVMNEITQWADRNGLILQLTPSADFGGNKKRLGEFYKRFGFVDNKGKNRDFETSETMLREPQGQRLEQGGEDDNARGSISFGARDAEGVRQFSIRLGPKSDLSTVLHEMGHFYLEVIGDLVQAGNASEALTADYAVIRDWLGAEEGQPLTVEQHEQFARGFEAYLAEGKAPSIELQNAFARFKRWLVSVYKDLTRLNVELNDEVRGVFGRLLASEEAIAEAEEALSLAERFESSILELMTDAERANYQRASQQARDEATQEIEQELLKADQRREQTWYREQRAEVEREVRAELEGSQPYQARKYLFGNSVHPEIGR
ncbi:MAG TPA: hypothetical protein VJN44_15845, partial [Roseateles sp.]|nr:hypothetical protein [Roseateles sp.]